MKEAPQPSLAEMGITSAVDVGMKMALTAVDGIIAAVTPPELRSEEKPKEDKPPTIIVIEKHAPLPPQVKKDDDALADIRSELAALQSHPAPISEPVAPVTPSVAEAA